MTYVAKDKQ